MIEERDLFKNFYNAAIAREKNLEEAITKRNLKIGIAMNKAFELGATDVMELIEDAILSSNN